MSTAPIPMETLLTHRDWVRRLARSLVRDESTADDVEQQAWLAALRRPPHHEDTSRAWLGRVVRNLASDSRRAHRRRDAHERTAARPEALRSTSEVIAESEAHMRVAFAVHQLPEPYRTTVLLRWFEDLPPRSVAERMDVPVETVRTRLRRAHDSLREDLGCGDSGDAGPIAVLVPFLSVRPEPAAVWSGVAAKTAALGDAVMGTKTAATVGVGVALAAGFLGGTFVHGWGGDGPDPAAGAEVAALRARIEELERTAGAAAGRRTAPGSDRKVAGIEDRVAALDARNAFLAASLEALRRDAASVTATGKVADAAPVPARDPADELARLRGLSDDDLLLAIRGLVGVPASGGKLDSAALVQACDVFLARNVYASSRAEVLIHKGVGHRTLKQRADAESAFRDAIAAAGAGTDEARSAEKQLAWTAQMDTDHRAAADIFLRLSRDPRASGSERASCRYSAAEAFDLARDPQRATAEYRSVIEEFETAEGAHLVVERARATLDAIAKRALDR